MKIKINESLVVVYLVIYVTLVGMFIYYIASQGPRQPGAAGAEASIGEAIVICFFAIVLGLIPIPFSIYFFIVKKHLSKTIFISSQIPFCLSLLFWLTVLFIGVR